MTRIGKAFDYILFLLSVPTCIRCKTRLDYDDLALCPKCSAEFEEIKTRNCSRCAKILSECNCSNEYLRTHFIKGVSKCFRYKIKEENMPANRIIYSLKRDNRSDVLALATRELSAAILNNHDLDDRYLITNVPRRKKSIVEYGFDHSALLAKSVAKNLGVEYRSLLVSHAKFEQKKLTIEKRLKNTDFSLKTDKVDLKGRVVIIVDDVITTGSSVGSAAMLVRSLGTRDIYAASLGIAYRDEYHPPIFQYNG